MIRSGLAGILNSVSTLLQSLVLSSPNITEATPAGVLVGNLSGIKSGSVLTLVDNAGGRFALSGTSIYTGSVATNFATAASHSITVRETLISANNSPRDTVLTITVSAIGSATQLLWGSNTLYWGANTLVWR